MGDHRYLGRMVGAVLLAVVLGACGSDDPPDGIGVAGTAATDTRAFCSLLAGVDADVEESYLGSPEHVAMLEEIAAAAPADLAPSLEVFLRYVRTSISPSSPGSADIASFPVEVKNAVDRISSYRTDTCGAAFPVTTTATPAIVPPATVSTAPRPTETPVVPEIANGVPQVKAVPASGPVGGRIRIEGDGFDDANWKAFGNPLWLVAGDGACSLYADAQHTVTVSAGGHLSGDFVVPATGTCRMSDLDDRPVRPGRYRIAFQCTACLIGEFEVAAGG